MYTERSDEELAAMLSDVDVDTARHLVELRTTGARFHNERIWGTGAFLVPLALGGVIALPRLGEDDQVWHVLALGLASSVLMLFWHAAAESHRAAQKVDERWVRSLELYLGVPPEALATLNGHGQRRRLTARRARVLVTVTVPMLWAAIVVVAILQ
ncbi:MAG: hypothetical protein CL424_08290 [Acidimicrobiaceae bacterium]|nr:hypothetical protein [Acidimicrobiaceae bacterium]